MSFPEIPLSIKRISCPFRTITNIRRWSTLARTRNCSDVSFLTRLSKYISLELLALRPAAGAAVALARLSRQLAAQQRRHALETVSRTSPVRILVVATRTSTKPFGIPSGNTNTSTSTPTLVRSHKPYYPFSCLICCCVSCGQCSEKKYEYSYMHATQRSSL
eukprot:scaffold412072_cov16-Prasinocladus_malaysianus.AAC.1